MIEVVVRERPAEEPDVEESEVVINADEDEEI